MFAFKIDMAKTRFFDRTAVTDRLTKAEQRVFSRVGANTRRTARSSIRPAAKGLLRRIGEKRRQLAAAKGKQRSKLRAELEALQARVHSKPGKPPKSITGALKDNIFFAFDPASHSVVIGPVLLNKSSGAQETLEFGGTTQIGPQAVEIEARPYMGPAYQKELPNAVALWKDAI